LDFRILSATQINEKKKQKNQKKPKTLMNSNSKGGEFLSEVVPILQGAGRVSSTVWGLWTPKWQGFI